MKKKWLAVGIILLFVGTIIVPSAPGNLLDDDTTPPITTINFDGTMGNDNWFISNVNISFQATDNQSGVNITYYRLDIGDWMIYTCPFKVTESGMHTINYYSIDNAGNSEEIKSVIFKIDQTHPDVWFATEKIRWGKFLIYAEASDYFSGIEKVEFYINDILKSTVFEPPYLWIYTGLTGFALVKAYDIAGNVRIPQVPTDNSNLNHLTGVISDVNITEATVTFNAIFVITHGAILANKQITYPNSYVGYIGKFFMNAVFYP